MEISNASGIARIARKLRVNCAYPHHPTPTPRPIHSTLTNPQPCDEGLREIEVEGGEGR